MNFISLSRGLLDQVGWDLQPENQNVYQYLYKISENEFPYLHQKLENGEINRHSNFSFKI